MEYKWNRHYGLSFVEYLALFSLLCEGGRLLSYRDLGVSILELAKEYTHSPEKVHKSTLSTAMKHLCEIGLVKKLHTSVIIFEIHEAKRHTVLEILTGINTFFNVTAGTTLPMETPSQVRVIPAEPERPAIKDLPKFQSADKLLVHRLSVCEA